LMAIFSSSILTTLVAARFRLGEDDHVIASSQAETKIEKTCPSTSFPNLSLAAVGN